ncbi:MAG: DUF4234 domain-containing protein [Anaeroplasmataceae bacterium]|nr:DUF4234 domain-containing protein [Anaeroplasmataceae bacterium]MDE6414762.1 DUF4234 domain-containing protein [Anaeroplasmataceae bacterium]
MQKRDVIVVILLGIFTCGIYSIYWFYTTAEALNNEVDDNEPLMNYILALLLGLITCGIYPIYWYWKFYSKLDKYTGENNAILNFILGLFVTSIAGMAIAQSSINKTVEA